MGTEKDIPFGHWLRREMKRRGYETEGPRAGGRTRLAKETGISLSVISRILIDNRVPETKALRAIGETFGYSLGEMMVHAGVANPGELGTQVIVAPEGTPTGPRDSIEIPPDVDLSTVQEWQRRIWLMPDLTVDERRIAIQLIRLYRDDLKDNAALLQLKTAVDEIVARALRRDNPSRAV